MDKNKAISGYEKIFDDGYKAGRASVVLPHPCDGELYKRWLSSDYFAKIAEEHLEVIDAYKSIEKSGKCPTEEEKEHFLKECTDLIIATTSLMNCLGYDEEARQRKMKEVNDDNAKRDGGKRFKSEAVDKNFKEGDKAKIIIPESEIRRYEKEGDVRKVQDMIITSNSVGRVVYHDSRLDTYALEVAGRIVGVPAEWLEKVEE